MAVLLGGLWSGAPYFRFLSQSSLAASPLLQLPVRMLPPLWFTTHATQPQSSGMRQGRWHSVAWLVCCVCNIQPPCACPTSTKYGTSSLVLLKEMPRMPRARWPSQHRPRCRCFNDQLNLHYITIRFVLLLQDVLRSDLSQSIHTQTLPEVPKKPFWDMAWRCWLQIATHATNRSDYDKKCLASLLDGFTYLYKFDVFISFNMWIMDNSN